LPGATCRHRQLTVARTVETNASPDAVQLAFPGQGAHCRRFARISARCRSRRWLSRAGHYVRSRAGQGGDRWLQSLGWRLWVRSAEVVAQDLGSGRVAQLRHGLESICRILSLGDPADLADLVEVLGCPSVSPNRMDTRAAEPGAGRPGPRSLPRTRLVGNALRQGPRGLRPLGAAPGPLLVRLPPVRQVMQDCTERPRTPAAFNR
jgi:hypothetical protein